MVNILYIYISNSRSRCAVHNMAVFCISWISLFPCRLLRYYINDFGMVPVSPVITGITFDFTFHMRCISAVRSLLLLLLLLLSSSSSLTNGVENKLLAVSCPRRAANSCSGFHEMIRILRNRTFHYILQKRHHVLF